MSTFLYKTTVEPKARDRNEIDYSVHDQEERCLEKCKGLDSEEDTTCLKKDTLSSHIEFPLVEHISLPSKKIQGANVAAKRYCQGASVSKSLLLILICSTNTKFQS